MPTQIPAWQRSRVRKQSVHTSLSLRRVENKLGLSVLLEHGVVMIYGDRSVSIPVDRGSDSKNRKVQAIRQYGRPKHGKNRGDEDSP
jgi:hypothetical protein